MHYETSQECGMTACRDKGDNMFGFTNWKRRYEVLASSVDEIVAHADACEERLNQYEAALEEIAAQVTPGANATVTRMGKIALDALNVEGEE